MANTKQAAKRARQSVKHRAHNVAARSRMRTQVKRVVKAAATGDREQTLQAYKEAVPVIDATVSKGLIHRNKAARHKSRLNARLKALTRA